MKSRLQKVIAIILTLTILVNIGLPIRAAEHTNFEDFIIDFEVFHNHTLVTEGYSPLTDGDDVVFRIGWLIPEEVFLGNYSAGDTITMELSEPHLSFQDFPESGMAELEDNGTVLAYWKIENGKIIIELTAEGAAKRYIGGYLNLNVFIHSVDEEKLLLVDLNNIENKIPVKPDNPGDPGGDPGGSFPGTGNLALKEVTKGGNVVGNSKTFSWYVHANYANAYDYAVGNRTDTLHNALFVDELPAGLHIETLRIANYIYRPKSTGEPSGSSALFFYITDSFDLITQNPGEDYLTFVNRVKSGNPAYGVYTADDGIQTILVYYGDMPGNYFIYDDLLQGAANSGSSDFKTNLKTISTSRNTNPPLTDDELELLEKIWSKDGEYNQINGAIPCFSVMFTTTADEYGKSYTNNAQVYYDGGELGPGNDKTLTTQFYKNIIFAGDPGTVKVAKMDESTEQPIRDAMFDLYRKDGTDWIKVNQAPLSTGEDGTVLFGGLLDGTYRLEEVTAAPGYDRLSVKYYLQGDDVNAVDEFIVNASDSTGVLIFATNRPEEETGSVELIKYNEDESQSLEGALFTLYDSGGEQVETGLVSDPDGKITVADLPFGDYYFIEEQAPQGYIRSDEEIWFTIDQNDTATSLSVINEKERPDERDVPGSVRLTKYNEDKSNTLEDAVFALYDSEDNCLSEDLITGSNGELLVDNLEMGRYYFIETAAPEGYLLEQSKIWFEIVDGRIQVELQVTNQEEVPGDDPSDDVRIRVELTKYNEDMSRVLKGAEFSLYDSGGRRLLEKLTTGDNGRLCVEDLEAGTYYFIETKAPEGYVLDRAKIAFTVHESDNDIIKLTFTNKLERHEGTETETETDSKAQEPGTETETDKKVRNSETETETATRVPKPGKNQAPKTTGRNSPRTGDTSKQIIVEAALLISLIVFTIMYFLKTNKSINKHNKH